MVYVSGCFKVASLLEIFLLLLLITCAKRTDYTSLARCQPNPAVVYPSFTHLSITILILGSWP